MPSAILSTEQSTVAATTVGVAHLPGSCTFVNNDTCGYELYSTWSVHKGEYVFHRPIISNGTGEHLIIHFTTKSNRLTVRVLCL